MVIINGELFLRYGNEPLEEKPFFFDDPMFSDSYSKIYQIAYTEKGMFYRTRDNDGELSDFKKTNIDNVKNELLPLTIYLASAEYMGLPADINYVDYDQQQRIINGIILYKDELYTLVYDFEPKNPTLRYLPLKVIYNDNLISYVVSGNKVELYSDPKELYHDLFAEILDTTKKNNKGRNK